MPPLKGLVVVDFSTLLPGPMATLMLAEAGAEVIKIEPLAGEAMRSYEPKWGDDSAIFAMLNRGKKTIAIDLKQPAARQEVIELVRRADVVVEQFRPGAMKRLGLDYEALSLINPQLIYCSITGYGQTGARVADAGHDINFAAETGFLALSMGDVGQAVLPATPIGDIGGGSYPAVINILLALEERRQTGRGRHIDIAMSENVFPFAYWALATGFSTGKWPGNGTDLVTGSSPRYRVYATRDRKGLVVGALEQKFWDIFCEAIVLRQDLRDDSLDPAATTAEIIRLIGLIDAGDLAALLAGKDCCCTFVRSLADAVKDADFLERGVFAAEVINESGAKIPALPVAIDAAFRAAPAAALAFPPLTTHMPAGSDLHA
jgi:alpha-methylacyl-CoA racemase